MNDVFSDQKRGKVGGGGVLLSRFLMEERGNSLRKGARAPENEKWFFMKKRTQISLLKKYTPITIPNIGKNTHELIFNLLKPTFTWFPHIPIRFISRGGGNSLYKVIRGCAKSLGLLFGHNYIKMGMHFGTFGTITEIWVMIFEFLGKMYEHFFTKKNTNYINLGHIF